MSSCLVAQAHPLWHVVYARGWLACNRLITAQSRTAHAWYSMFGYGMEVGLVNDCTTMYCPIEVSQLQLLHSLWSGIKDYRL